MRESSSKTIVIISFIVDFIDIVLSLAVTMLSGSVVMLSQFLEGVADLISSGLLLVGLTRASQKEDREHPFGYGREIYFWALMSGMVMFAITATLSILFGWQRFIHPQEVKDIYLTFLVLTITAVTNGIPFYLSFKKLLKNRSREQVLGIFLRTSLIEIKTTFILDLMGMSASILGLVALTIYKFSGDYRFDGLGAILIGVILAVLAFILLIGILDMIVGRSAGAEVEKEIKLTALNTREVKRVLGIKTLHIGSEKLLVNLKVHFEHDLKTRRIENLIRKIKADIQKKVPEVKHIQVELETP